MSLGDFPLLRTNHDLGAAVEAWTAITGHDAGVRGDAVLEDCLVHLTDAGLMQDDTLIGKTVLALLSGAILHGLADLGKVSERGKALHLIESTRRVAEVVAAMETPTGFEEDPETLARVINESVQQMGPR